MSSQHPDWQYDMVLPTCACMWQGTSNELLPDAPVWILGVEHSPVEPTTTAENNQLHAVGTY